MDDHTLRGLQIDELEVEKIYNPSDNQLLPITMTKYLNIIADNQNLYLIKQIAANIKYTTYVLPVEDPGNNGTHGRWRTTNDISVIDQGYTFDLTINKLSSTTPTECEIEARFNDSNGDGVADTLLTWAKATGRETPTRISIGNSRTFAQYTTIQFSTNTSNTTIISTIKDGFGIIKNNKLVNGAGLLEIKNGIQFHYTNTYDYTNTSNYETAFTLHGITLQVPEYLTLPYTVKVKVDCKEYKSDLPANVYFVTERNQYSGSPKYRRTVIRDLLMPIEIRELQLTEQQINEAIILPVLRGE